MIFVTVGTHEQQFNRLVECVDNLKRTGAIKEDVVIQTGYSTYEPANCEWQKFFPYQEMLRLVKEARIVITHGGPSSFIMPLQIGKTPIVVPRRRKFDEHVNDHQVAFSQAVAERMGMIIVIDEEEKLEERLAEAIQNYDEMVRGMGDCLKSHNAEFNAKFGVIADELLKGKREDE